MKKAALQFLVIAALFFACWGVLSQINWIMLFGIEQTTLNTEEKLGEMIWDIMKRSETVIVKDSLTAPLDSIIDRICTSNSIDRDKIKLHLVKKEDINAFALPGNHLVVYSGLIAACNNEAELAGVLGHEIGHMENNHVMRKLIKETGFAVLVSLTSGNGNSENAKQILKLLSSSAYDRSLETEADLSAADYLIKSHINPTAMADLFYRMSAKESDIQNKLGWIHTHPDSRERAKKIVEYVKGKKVRNEPVLAKGTWATLKSVAE